MKAPTFLPIALFTKIAERLRKRRHAVQRAMERFRLSESAATRLVNNLETRLNKKPARQSYGWVRIKGGTAAVGRYNGKYVVKTVLSPHMTAAGSEVAA